MAMTFLELQDSILHQIGDFSEKWRTKAKRWLNDARNNLWEEIHGEFKESTDYITTTASYSSDSTTTVTVTNGSTTVSSDGSSNTAFTSAMAGRYVQLNGTDPWYRIAAYVSATEITLEDAYIGDSDTECAFEVHTYHWAMPSGVQHLLQVTVELESRWTALEIVDRTDALGELPAPLRWSDGTPSICWVDEKDASGNYYLGIYPVPSSATMIRLRYAEELTEMSDNDDVIGIPGGDIVVKAHALFEAYTYRQRIREASLWLNRYYDARNRLPQTVDRSKGTIFRRRDHTDAATGRRRRPNLGANFA